MAKKNKIIAIVQARTNSTRLPGKVLKKIGNKTVIEIINLRLKKSKLIDKIIFAIPENDEKLKNYLMKKKFNLFQGSAEDVLDRYYRCAKKENASAVIRITGDCPLIDSELIDKAISIFLKKKNIHILTNYTPPTFPNGLDFSIFSFNNLKTTWNNANTEFDREHVVPYLLKSKKSKKFNFKNKIDQSQNRWTLDEYRDLIVLRNIFKKFNNYTFSWRKVINLRDSQPDLFKTNQNIQRNEGSKINYTEKLLIRYKNYFIYKIPNNFSKILKKIFYTIKLK